MRWLHACPEVISRRRQCRSVRQRLFRPQLERLEDRCSPAAHDTLTTALLLSFAAGPVVQVSGTLTTANQVDLYAVQLNQGDQFTAAINAQQQGSSLQAALRLFDGKGVELPAVAGNTGSDPQLSYSVPLSGKYYVGVSSSGDGSYDPATGGNRRSGNSTGLFTLRVNDLLARFVSAPSLTSNGQPQHGTLSSGQPQDYRVTVANGATGDTFLLATAVPQSSPGFEPRVSLYDGTGQLLIQSDQQQPGLASATVEQHLQAGAYYLEVSAAASTSTSARHQAYQLTTILAASLPPFLPLPVGSGAESVGSHSAVVTDLGNGHPDIVTTNASDGTVSVLLGNGDGSFQPQQTFAVGSFPHALVVADLGNGHPDLVTANEQDNTVSVLLGNGDGSFQPALSFGLGDSTYPSSVAVADIDGDGRPDIVTANQSDNTVSVLLGNGAGGFSPDPVSSPGLNPVTGQPSPPGTFAVGNAPDAVAVANLGNGRSDIVTANFDGTVSVLLGNGDGSFQPQQTLAVGNLPTQLVVADLTGDGILDIVTANYEDNTVSVLLGNGDGSFHPQQTFAVGNTPNALVVADLGNGHPDLVTINQNYDPNTGTHGIGTVSVLLDNGDGSFQPAQSYAVGSQPDAVIVADLGNGHPDIVTANEGDSTVSVLLGNGNGSFQPQQTFAVGPNPMSVSVADLGTGHPDLVIANETGNTVSVLLGNGNGTFQSTPHSIVVGGRPGPVVVADLSGDGIPDIVNVNAGVYLNSPGTVSALLGNGDGTFQPTQSFAVGSSPGSVVVADVNGDGRPDLVTANFYDGTVSVLLGNGDGTFTPDPFSSPGLPPGTISVGKSPGYVAVADLGNGHLDIVTASDLATFDPATHILHSTVSVALGNGDGSFQPAQSYVGEPFPRALAVVDLTGNGIPDIVTADTPDPNTAANYSTLSVWLGNGDGTFSPGPFSSPGLPPGTFAVQSGVRSIALADLTGNGIPDIVATFRGNTISVLLGNGKGGFTPDPFSSPGLPPGTFAVGSGFPSIALADLNGDGRPDIVIANRGTDFTHPGNTVSVLLGNGDGSFQPQQSFIVGSGPIAVAVADLNGDGRPDLVTDNEGGFSQPVNTVSVLLNQGTGQFQPPTGASNLPRQNIPRLQDLTGDGIPDAVSLDQRTGQVLLRQGTGDPNNPYAPLVVVNPDHPATGFTLVQTKGLPEIAALDSIDQEVILYAWSNSAGRFQQMRSFATGPQPVRIASADLDGNGLGDIVVGNDLNNTLTIALQQSSGIINTFTRNIDAGPSSISFADLNGDGLPYIVVSDQVSGDVTVLFNDPSHSFTSQQRYRAGQGPFALNSGPSGTTVLSQLQTVGAVAAHFTRDGRTDLVALNANSESFSLLRAAGRGSLIDPQQADTYLVGPGAVQVLAGDFLHNGRQDLAVLTTQANPSQPSEPGTSQVLVFLNNGDGTFRPDPDSSPGLPPGVFAAGQGATGFSFVAASSGRPDRLLVGDAYGDFLTLLGNGNGQFTVDRGNLDGKPLAVGKTAAGQTFVVVADQSQDQVQVYLQNSGAGVAGSSPFVLSTTLSGNPALLAPGAVQLVDLNKSGSGNGTPDLVVASRLGNAVLVYPGLPGGGFGNPQFFPVGFEPDALTCGDFNGDGIPDLAVTNQGSNDVSILLGQADSIGAWAGFTHGPRLNSGGSEPLAVQAGPFTDRPGILDLRVTNASGQIATLPGIGSQTSAGTGAGTGFFQDNAPQINPAGATIAQVTFDAATGRTFVVLADGSLESFNGTTFIPDPRVSGVTQVSAANGELAVALEDGVEVMDETGGEPEVAENFSDQPSALQILQSERGLEVVVALPGSDVPLLLTGFTALPVAVDVPRSSFLVEATSLPEANLVLVATLLAGELVAPAAGNAGLGQAGAQGFELFLPPVLVAPNGANGAPKGGNGQLLEDADQVEQAPPAQGPNIPEWQRYRLGAEDALSERLWRQQVGDNLQDALDALKWFFNKFAGNRKAHREAIGLEREGPAGPAEPTGELDGEERELFARPELLPGKVPAWALGHDSEVFWLRQPPSPATAEFLSGREARRVDETTREEWATVGGAEAAGP